MKAQLKGIITPGINDLSKYNPVDLENFGFLLQIIVGPKDQLGEESFDITVCTPKWLYQQYDTKEIIIGRHFLFMFRYDHDALIKKINSFLEQCNGDTWNEVALKVSRLGHWEFEDYQS